MILRKITRVLISGICLLWFQYPASAQTSAQKSTSADKPVSELTVQELQQLIDRQIEAKLQQYGLRGEAMQSQIAAGILAFVKKQNEARDPNNLAKNLPPVDRKRDHIQGNPDAEVTLVEYSDFECPFCKRFHPTVKQLLTEYDGKVNWVYRHFPLNFHNPEAENEAVAAECAAELGGNTAFWQYTDAIYERTRSNKSFPLKNLTPMAVEFGLDGAEFQKCLEEKRHMDRIRKDLAEGSKAGVSGTPGNILIHNASGQVIAIPGAQPIDELRKAVEHLLQSQG